MAEAVQQQRGVPLTTNVFLGATFDAVQGHYSKQWSSDSYEATTQDHEHYYQLKSKPREYTQNKFSCGPCNRSFFSHKQYKKHLDEHVKCPFPECNLSANIKVIDQHISHQHMLVNFEALQVDDEKWIADRKKRFPTAERAELRRAEQMERLKRGARLGLERKTMSKTGYKSRGPGSKFIGDSKRQNTKESFEQDDKNKRKIWKPRKYKSLMEKREAHENNIAEIDLFDSDDESKGGIPAFKGMTEFFENSGELSLFGIKGSQVFEDIAISDDDDGEWKSLSDAQEGPPKNALGLLMGNYSSDSEIEMDKGEQSSSLNIVTSDTQNKNGIFLPKHSKEALLNKESGENNINNSNEVKYHKKRQRFHKRGTNDYLQPNLTSKQKSKFYNKRKRKQTLLERLLEPDIIRERNMILQCIRYIINENYFENKTVEQQNEDQVNSDSSMK